MPVCLSYGAGLEKYNFPWATCYNLTDDYLFIYYISSSLAKLLSDLCAWQVGGLTLLSSHEPETQALSGYSAQEWVRLASVL